MKWYERIPRWLALILVIAMIAGQGLFTWYAIHTPRAQARLYTELARPFSGIDFFLGFAAATMILVVLVLLETWRFSKDLSLHAGPIRLPFLNRNITVSGDGTIKIDGEEQ